MADDNKTPLAKVIDALATEKPAAKKAPVLSYLLAKTNKEDEPVEKAYSDPSLNSKLAKSIMNVLNGGNKASIESLAFERDPGVSHDIAIYRPKLRLTPDAILKRIAIQDDLIATIVRIRANQISQYGSPPEDRFSNGFRILPDENKTANYTEEQKEELRKRIAKATAKLLTCGSTDNVKLHDRITFGQYLYQSVRNGMIVGRSATELRWAFNVEGERVFHSFRPVDAGTIYFASEQATAGLENIRESAKGMLERLRGEKFKGEAVQPNKDIAWVQVCEGTPRQAFYEDELLVHDYWPVTDIELGGYPLTPIDTMLAAVTTHINITNHNKAYFENGRAARGMLIIKSPDLNVTLIEAMRQQFNASINGTKNAFRMPVFGCGPEDEVTWQQIETAGRDMEFQYLSDTNARVILAAYQMSPEEVPGYQHLSRGTNTQSLSESNNEYKLTAARDVGIRPLITQIEDFLNAFIFPLIDPKLAEICRLKFVGLDSDTLEKETIHIEQWSGVYGNMNRILEKVELDAIPKQMGGEFPFNQAYWQIAKTYLTFGQILEYWFNVPGASNNPELAFYQNVDWMNYQNILMQKQQMQMAAQQGGGDGGGPPSPSGDGGVEQPKGPQSAPSVDSETEQKQSGLASGINELMGTLGKSEAQLTPQNKRILAQQKSAVKSIMDAWEKDKRKALEEIVSIADKHTKG